MKAKRKNKMLLIVAIAILVCVVLFSSCACSNSGRIQGLDGGRYNASFDYSLTPRGSLDWLDNSIISIISDREELVAWHQKELERISDDRSDSEQNKNNWNENLKNFDLYDDTFFETKQLIFIVFAGARLDYRIEKVSYNNQTLTAEVKRIVPLYMYIACFSIHAAPIDKSLLIEVTRMPNDFNVEFIEHI